MEFFYAIILSTFTGEGKSPLPMPVAARPHVIVDWKLVPEIA